MNVEVQAELLASKPEDEHSSKAGDAKIEEKPINKLIIGKDGSAKR